MQSVLWQLKVPLILKLSLFDAVTLLEGSILSQVMHFPHGLDLCFGAGFSEVFLKLFALLYTIQISSSFNGNFLVSRYCAFCSVIEFIGGFLGLYVIIYLIFLSSFRVKFSKSFSLVFHVLSEWPIEELELGSVSGVK